MKVKRAFLEKSFSALMLMGVCASPAVQAQVRMTLEGECIAANVTHLEQVESSSKAPESEDPSWYQGTGLCRLDSTDLRFQPLSETLQKVANQNARIEEKTRLDLRKLIPGGIRLQVDLNASGPLTSAALYFSQNRSAWVRLGLYADGSGFHRSIYTHEMGHAVNDSFADASESYPAFPVLAVLGKNSVTFEAFADLFAHTVMGSYFASEAELTGCFADLRAYRQMLSYRGPLYRYSAYLPAMRMQSCCRRMESEKRLTAIQKSFCQDFGGDVISSIEAAKSAWRDSLSDTLSKIKAKPVDVDAAEKMGMVFDEHQLAIPWSTWILSMSKREGVDPIRFLSQALSDFSAQEAAYSCGLYVDGAQVSGGEDGYEWRQKFTSLARVNQAILNRHSRERGFYQRMRFEIGSEISDRIQLDWSEIKSKMLQMASTSRIILAYAYPACLPDTQDPTRFADEEKCQIRCSFEP